MSVEPIHCHVDNVSRQNGDGGERSVVAKAAYNAGVTLWNERENKFTNFSGRNDVVWSDIFAPDGAPDWVLDRGKLWNRVESFARRRDARLAKSIDVAIPRSAPRQDWRGMAAAYAQRFVALGMVADAAVHEDGTDHNPHVHVLLTVNALKPDGFGAKLTLADAKSFVSTARTGWETICNEVLAASGSDLRVDARSYQRRGVDKTPTKHRGPDPAERRARRAHARQVREDPSMTRAPTAFERYQFPHLADHPDFPFADNVRPDGLSPEQSEEFDRLLANRQRETERAAVSHREEVEPPSLERSEDHERRTREPVWSPAVVETTWEQPSLEDFREDPLVERLSRERVAYEADLWGRAVNMGRTRQEHALITRAEAVSPEAARQVKEILFDRRIARLREEDDAARLDRFEARFGPALREPFEDYVRDSWPEWDRLPMQAPDHELTTRAEIARAQDRLVEDYERDPDERDR